MKQEKGNCICPCHQETIGCEGCEKVNEETNCGFDLHKNCVSKQTIKEAIEKKMIGIQRDSRLFYELDTLKDELFH